MAAPGSLQPLPVADWTGFRVQSAEGWLGLVEEVWLGAADERAGVAVRLPDGRRGLLLGDDIGGVFEDGHELFAVPGARLLELDVPRLEGGPTEGERDRLAAYWATTGVLLPMPARPYPLARLPVRLGRSPRPAAPRPVERPIWKTILVLYSVIAFLAALLMTAAFLAAYIASGHAY